VPGTAVFLNGGKARTPHIPAAEAIADDELGHKDDRIVQVTAASAARTSRTSPACYADPQDGHGSRS